MERAAFQAFLLLAVSTWMAWLPVDLFVAPLLNWAATGEAVALPLTRGLLLAHRGLR